MPRSKKAEPARSKSAKKPRSRAQQSPTSPKPAKVTKTENRIERFVTEYLVDLNGRQAAIRAGYSPDSARFTASEILARPEVQARVAQAMVERANRTGITADRVLERLWNIATADPRELIELHRGCCRYCWGKDHRYQRTPREMEEARGQWRAEAAERQENGGRAVGEFDEAGGVGWNPKRDPNPACPECWGDGVESVVPKDTRDLSPAARMLYAGVKTTQHGLQVLTHDQKGALVDVGKHLGLFRDRMVHENPDGSGVTDSVLKLLQEISDSGGDTGVHESAGRR